MNRSHWPGGTSVLRAGAVLTVLAALSLPATRAAAQSGDPEVTATAEHELKLPYRGSIAVYEHATRLWAYSGEELTYNPSWVQSLSLRPRWYFNDNVWTRFRLDLQQELTDADDTTDRNEVQVALASLDFNYSDFRLFENSTLAARITLGLPADKISQLRSMYLSTGARVAVDYTIPSVLHGLKFTFAPAFTKYFNRYVDGDSDVLQYCTAPTRGETEACSSTGTMNPSYRLVWEGVAELQILENLGVSLSFLLLNYWTYDPPNADVATLTGDVAVERSPDDTRFRSQTWVTLEASYDVTKYLNVALGADTLSSSLQDDGSYRNPFFNRFTNLYLDLTLTVDELVKAVSPSATASLGPRTAMRVE